MRNSISLRHLLTLACWPPNVSLPVFIAERARNANGMRLRARIQLAGPRRLIVSAASLGGRHLRKETQCQPGPSHAVAVSSRSDSIRADSSSFVYDRARGHELIALLLNCGRHWRHPIELAHPIRADERTSAASAEAGRYLAISLFTQPAGRSCALRKRPACGRPPAMEAREQTSRPACCCAGRPKLMFRRQPLRVPAPAAPARCSRSAGCTPAQFEQ